MHNEQVEPSVGAALERVQDSRVPLSRNSNRIESLRQYAFFRVLDEWDERSGHPRTWRFGFYIGVDSVAGSHRVIERAPQ